MTAAERWRAVPIATQLNLQGGGDLADAGRDLPPPCVEEPGLDIADAVLRINKQMDLALRVAMRAENDGMLLNGRMMKQIIWNIRIMMKTKLLPSLERWSTWED